MSRKLDRWIYRIGINTYFGAIRIISPFHSKAKAMVEGRKAIFETLKSKRKGDEEWVMIHTSSVGEFEQARPIIEWIRKEHPELKICLTFFSPSGYKAFQSYSLADMVTYLPFDNSSTLQSFIEQLSPKFVLIIKYEFWLRTISLLHKNNIPIYLISSIFREEQPFFKKRIGIIFREALSQIKILFIQNKVSAELLEGIDVKNYIISGDTRMDRVAQIKEQGHEIKEMGDLRDVALKEGKKILVAGSTWEADEKILLKYAGQKEILLILVPHEVDEGHIQQIINRSPLPTTRITEWDKKSPEDVQLLIVDKIGLLSTLYRYADIAYVGGGFGKGIHNTLEAAVYGIPILFGPKYHKFQEAKDLINVGAGFSIKSYKGFAEQMDTLVSDPSLRKSSGQAAKNLVYNQLGATEIVTSTIEKDLFK